MSTILRLSVQSYPVRGGVDWHSHPLRGLVRVRVSQEGTALVPLDIVPLVIDGEVSLGRCGEM